ncbi:glutathione S-transferase N-terminal domain-containing protein [Cardiobacterium valvarum]|uniref:Glutathionine S-transferase n=1 Tax=Cardiobacterium valvarum TaxID=194702 RepID=A0A381DYG3_9GAMM|nr:glutathione S-transferase N-terminal domain-containing protein [Cardiobacterium valvarum]SUX18400.1 glutathionine S-transferase [Cardiobacterium valvarum]
MKLYLSTTSPYARLALIAALRSGKNDLQLQFVLPWEDPAALLAVNPFSQIPALHCDDGHLITESLIIMQYLDDRVLRGGGTCARAGWGIAAINQTVRAFALNMHQPPGSISHPHIARSRAALTRALPLAPQLDASSEDWGHLILGVALNYIRMRLPDIYDAHITPDNRRAVDTFLQRDFMQKTDTAQLQKLPARVADL